MRKDVCNTANRPTDLSWEPFMFTADYLPLRWSFQSPHTRLASIPASIHLIFERSFSQPFPTNKLHVSEPFYNLSIYSITHLLSHNNSAPHSLIPPWATLVTPYIVVCLSFILLPTASYSSFFTLNIISNPSTCLYSLIHHHLHVPLRHFSFDETTSQTFKRTHDLMNSNHIKGAVASKWVSM